MPSRLPVPISALPGGPLNPVDWTSLPGLGGVEQQAMMRGHPVALAAWQRRQVGGPATIPQSREWFFHSRPYSRGAQAFAPQFGVLNINPIGAGVYAPYRLPSIAGPGARYQFGAIWFDAQVIPTTVRMSPTMSMGSLDALLATSQVAAMYATTG